MQRLGRKALRFTVFLVAATLAAASLSSCGGTSAQELQTIEVQLRSVLELPTYEHIYREVVYVSRERSILMFSSHARVLFSVDVRVQAGIDLNEGLRLTPKSSPGRKEIVVALPPARILMVDADEKSINQYFLDERGESISRLDYYDEIDLKKGEIIADAIDRGILVKADQNARNLIRSFLKMAGFDSVTFQTLAVGGRAGDA